MKIEEEVTYTIKLSKSEASNLLSAIQANQQGRFMLAPTMVNFREMLIDAGVRA